MRPTLRPLGRHRRRPASHSRSDKNMARSFGGISLFTYFLGDTRTLNNLFFDLIAIRDQEGIPPFEQKKPTHTSCFSEQYRSKARAAESVCQTSNVTRRPRRIASYNASSVRCAFTHILVPRKIGSSVVRRLLRTKTSVPRA